MCIDINTAVMPLSTIKRPCNKYMRLKNKNELYTWHDNEFSEAM